MSSAFLYGGPVQVKFYSSHSSVVWFLEEDEMYKGTAGEIYQRTGTLLAKNVGHHMPNSNHLK